MFEGAHTALVTPFSGHGIDANSFRDLIDQQFANGITGIVPVGTTGESPTLSHEEHIGVIQLAVSHARKRGLVIAGTGSNSTDEAITFTQAAEKAGADAALLVAPYYNKPSQEGVYRHFRAVADATEIPLILYSIPGRCGIEIAVDTVARLANNCPNIRAIKEAGGSVERVSELMASLPPEFEILSGDDSMTLPFMAVGGVGVISVASNLIPRTIADLVNAMAEGRLNDARAIHRDSYRLFHAFLKLDTNPVPIKTALELAGKCSGDVRLPMTGMPEEKRNQLAAILRDMGILAGTAGAEGSETSS